MLARPVSAAGGYTHRMSFALIQKQVDDYIGQFDEGYFPPLEMLARLTEELGELSRALSHHTGFKKPKDGEATGDVGDELCDLIFVAVCLANSMQIDLDAAFAATMNKYYVRDANRWTRKTPIPS
jgi:NTP pyrophosphatase (non-canonical NTP hydrolase)